MALSPSRLYPAKVIADVSPPEFQQVHLQEREIVSPHNEEAPGEARKRAAILEKVGRSFQKSIAKIATKIGPVLDKDGGSHLDFADGVKITALSRPP